MKNVSSKVLDHLGLVAGCFDEFGIAGIVDGRLPARIAKQKIGFIVLVMGLMLRLWC